MPRSHPAGVMEARYAQERKERPELVYRFRVRGQLSVDAFRRLRPDLRCPRVLDLGAAEGLTLLHMHTLIGGGEFWGLEYSETLVKYAPPLPEGVRLLRGDVCALPLEVARSYFDLVTCLAVLEHLERPERAVAEAFSALQPGGVFIASCPSPFWDRLAGSLGLVRGDHHSHRFGGRALRDICLRVGFRRVSYARFMFALTGVLPYVGLGLDPGLSLRIDAKLGDYHVLWPFFVNQAIVAEKQELDQS